MTEQMKKPDTGGYRQYSKPDAPEPIRDYWNQMYTELPRRGPTKEPSWWLTLFARLCAILYCIPLFSLALFVGLLKGFGLFEKRK
jgi:hypothetical protein